ncbi:hypothetical protein D6C90_06849 [Aureobasidium pullulans]|uniref:BTB domain-containing protein n=1 Tax=Aureobasidium pullulans TaxID=5580 RepID=A0A4S9UEY3_AURPU|nr:hypothetical protein D6C90_06849 [Aureobasidium pullulans]
MATDTSASMPSGSAPGSALQDFASQDPASGTAPQVSTFQNSAPSQPTPPPPFYPPLFTIGDGDVVISIMPGPKNKIRVSSTLLGEKSHVFSAMLSSRWDYNKRTVEEVCLADGTSSQVRRFELVFDNNGSYLLGKATSENAHRRRAIALATIEGAVYRSFIEKSLCHTKFGLPYSEREWRMVMAINYLCFAMLFELPLEHTSVQRNILDAKQMIAMGYPARVTCIVFRVLEWIDYYGVLYSIRHKFALLIIHMVPQKEINEHKLAYLRLASLLRDTDLLAHLADNDLLFGESLVSQCGPLENRYGVKRWLVECERSLYVLHDISWDLLNAPRRSEGVEFSAPASRAACQRWYEWMLQLREEASLHRLFTDLTWSHAGALDLPLALLPPARAALFTGFTGFGIANSHPQLTQVEVNDAEQLMRTWTASVLDQIRAHVDKAHVRGGFRLNYDTFFERSKCPWDYRQKDSLTEIDEILLSQLVVNNSLSDLIGH